MTCPNYPATSLSDHEKNDLKRFTGYTSSVSGAFAAREWRYSAVYDLLEYRLNNAGPAELRIIQQYLTQLYLLDSPRELQDREHLFDEWRGRLCGFLGIPRGPALQLSGNTLGMVV
jgi:hypothetical protein